MGVHITIRQKGFFKKGLIIKDFLGTTFSYGIWDMNILVENKRDAQGFILYNP